MNNQKTLVLKEYVKPYVELSDPSFILFHDCKWLLNGSLGISMSGILDFAPWDNIIRFDPDYTYIKKHILDIKPDFECELKRYINLMPSIEDLNFLHDNLRYTEEHAKEISIEVKHFWVIKDNVKDLIFKML